MGSLHFKYCTPVKVKKGTAARDEAPHPEGRKSAFRKGKRGHLLTSAKPVAERTPGGVPFFPKIAAQVENLPHS
jgi:hypothetical protein